MGMKVVVVFRLLHDLTRRLPLRNLSGGAFCSVRKGSVLRQRSSTNI